MYLVRLVYVSTITDRQNNGAVQEIIRVAHSNNEKHNLTGLMVFSSKHFMQVIEGGREAVSQLLGNLYVDPRHTNMQVMGMEEISQRAFPDWNMRFVPVASATRQILLRHGITQDFEPYAMPYARALGLLLEMQAVA